MSIVIIGGNERMVCQYTDICKGYGYKAKIFPKENGSIRKKIGSPDLMVPVYQYRIPQNGIKRFTGGQKEQYSCCP